MFAKPATTAFGGSSNASPFGQAASNTTTGSSIFGQPAASTTTGSSLFGQPQNQQNQNQNQNQNQQQTGTNAFGTSGLFGASQAQQPQQQQQQQQQAGSNAFATSSLFGQPQQQQQQNAQSGFYQSQAQQPVQRASMIWEEGRDSPNQKPIVQQCEAIFEKWNPRHPNTVFKYYLYNQVDPSNIPFYQPGPNEDRREWEEAVHNRPHKDHMPALATGFEALGSRLQIQKAVLGQYNSRLHEINACLDGILSKHDLETSVRANNARRKHVLLRQRCLALASKVQTLRNRGYALDADEDELKTKMEALERAMSDPALSARNEELWSRLILLSRQADMLRNEIQSRGGDNGEQIPDEVEAKAKKLLQDYDKQLQALKNAVDKIKEDYDEWEKEHNPSTKQSSPKR